MRIELVRSAIAFDRPTNLDSTRENARSRGSQPSSTRHIPAEPSVLGMSAHRRFRDNHPNFVEGHRHVSLAFVHVRVNTDPQVMVRHGSTDSSYLSSGRGRDYSRSVIGLTSQLKPYDLEVK